MMKKGWKIFWIVCASLFGFAVALCIIGVAMGGTLVGITKVFDNMHIKEERIIMYNGWDNHDDYGRGDDTADISANGDGIKKFSGIRELELEVSYLQVIVKQGDGDSVLVDTSKLDKRQKDKLRCKNEDGELSIELKNHGLFDSLGRNHENQLIIQLPRDRAMEDASFTIGAGQLMIEALNSGSLEMNVGAGQAIVKNFHVKDLDVDCGAGQAELNGTISGKTELNCGVGEIKMDLAGRQKDYDYRIKCGVGKIKIGNDKYAGLGTERHIDNGNDGTDRKMDINCGVGKIELSFGEGQ